MPRDRRGGDVDRVVAGARPDDQREAPGVHDRLGHLGRPDDQHLGPGLGERGRERRVLERRVVHDVAADGGEAVEARSFELVRDEDSHALLRSVRQVAGSAGARHRLEPAGGVWSRSERSVPLLTGDGGRDERRNAAIPIPSCGRCSARRASRSSRASSARRTRPTRSGGSDGKPSRWLSIMPTRSPRRRAPRSSIRSPPAGNGPRQASMTSRPVKSPRSTSCSPWRRDRHGDGPAFLGEAAAGRRTSSAQIRSRSRREVDP